VALCKGLNIKKNYAYDSFINQLTLSSHIPPLLLLVLLSLNRCESQKSLNRRQRYIVVLDFESATINFHKVPFDATAFTIK
jgi:hypothetical protein